MLAREIMTKKPLTVKSILPIHKVVQLFLQWQISSAPVTDLNDKVIGTITVENLMKIFSRVIASDNREQTLEHFLDLLLPPRFVRASTPLPQVVSAMLGCPTKRVIVQDDSEAIVGIITPKDILRTLSGQKQPGLQSRVEELEEKNKALMQALKEKQTSHFENGLEDSPFMVFSVDHGGKIIRSNSRLAHFLGYDESLTGMSVFQITPKHSHDHLQKNILSFNENTRHKSEIISLQTRMGELRRVEITIAAVGNGEVLIMANHIDGDALLRALSGLS